MRGACWVMVALIGVGCDGGSEPDAGARLDASVEADAGLAIECEVPAPVVAGTPETDALADAPARCGQPAHAWLRSDTLGAVVDAGEPERMSRLVLDGIIAGAGLTAPRPAGADVTLRVVRYLTQDRGAEVEATTLVAYPDVEERGQILDVVVFLHGTSGFTAGCGSSEDTAYRALVALFASYGYLAIAPDYLGLEAGEASYGELHPYLSGQATAIASLDAVRAAARLPVEARGWTCAAPRFVTVGGSQGGHAALWVERLQPYYARELELVGTVATVPPADLMGQIQRGLTEVVSATGNTIAFYGTAPFWYGVGDRLDEVFVSPFDVDVPAALRAECSPSEIPDVTRLDEVFTAELLDAAAGDAFGALDPWGCIVRENGLTTTSVPRLGPDASSYGVLMVTGEADALVHTPIERAAFETLCEAGVPLRYLECEGADHGEGTLWALPEIVSFAEARLAGEAFEPPASCAPPPPSRCEGTP